MNVEQSAMLLLTKDDIEGESTHNFSISPISAQFDDDTVEQTFRMGNSTDPSFIKYQYATIALQLFFTLIAGMEMLSMNSGRCPRRPSLDYDRLGVRVYFGVVTGCCVSVGLLFYVMGGCRFVSPVENKDWAVRWSRLWSHCLWCCRSTKVHTAEKGLSDHVTNATEAKVTSVQLSGSGGSNSNSNAAVMVASGWISSKPDDVGTSAFKIHAFFAEKKQSDEIISYANSYLRYFHPPSSLAYAQISVGLSSMPNVFSAVFSCCWVQRIVFTFPRDMNVPIHMWLCKCL